MSTMVLIEDRLVTWWTVFRISLEERLVYRGDFAIGTLMRFLPIITQIFLWWAVYESISGQRLVGYSFSDMVAYYLLTMLARAFSSMPGLASSIARSIRDGDIKKYLTQPVDLIGFLFLGRMAHKVAYYSVAFAPFGLVFFLCSNYFEHGWPAWPNLLAFLASLLMGFVLGFFLETCIGLIGFWFLEVSSLLFVYMLFSFFLSGHMFPLDMLGEPWSSIVGYLPLKYLAYFPSVVFLEKVTGRELAIDLLVELAWIVFFVILSRWMYRRGLQSYSAFGG
jgi:ABC-2 type transport system permease protein